MKPRILTYALSLLTAGAALFGVAAVGTVHLFWIASATTPRGEPLVKAGDILLMPHSK